MTLKPLLGRAGRHLTVHDRHHHLAVIACLPAEGPAVLYLLNATCAAAAASLPAKVVTPSKQSWRPSG